MQVLVCSVKCAVPIKGARRANAGLAAWPSVLASKIHPEPKALPSLLARLVERFADPLDQIAAGGVGLAL
jgi:hypothetical protein